MVALCLPRPGWWQARCREIWRPRRPGGCGLGSQRADGTWVLTVAGEIGMSNAGVFLIAPVLTISGLADLVTVRGLSR